ncbi:hypothetical protein D1BOALGB6SA_6933 [Olavius sp. associated proteobacterium Delta 1]|nr:hypothetical protein D1BOALGB6SA_6933 [Olavius sp. associated proteobacterium Delta 1]
MAYIGATRNINGKVVDKYKLGSGNLGVIVVDEYGKRYSVEFQSYSAKPSLSNLYGLINDPFRENAESIDRLVEKGSYIGVDVGCSDHPLRYAYRLNYVSAAPVHYRLRPEPSMKAPYSAMGSGKSRYYAGRL